MFVFVIGATGWVGSAVVRELLNAGHRVAGLARSDDKAAELTALGAQAIRGTVDDHDILRSTASAADAVIHTAFIDEGSNRWAGVYRLDAARVYRLALEQGVTESVYHAVADEGVPFKQIAEVIGRRLGLPVESRSREHFGGFANFAGADMCASSARTRALLGWQPTGPDLLTDIDQPGYYGK